MFVNFNILNQLGSPAINSNTFANRPAAGQTGRLFVSTDTFEIYRDNGTSWDLIGGPGSSTVTGTGASGQVTYWTGASTIAGNNNLFWDIANSRLGIGTTTPGHKLQINGTGTLLSLNGGSDTYMLFAGNGADQYQIGYTDNALDYRRFSIYDSTGAKEVLTIDKQSRNVGINYQYSSLADQPAYTFDVSGSIRSTDSTFLATNGTSQVGINTVSPVATALIQANKTDGYGLYLNYTTNAGSGTTATALWAINTTAGSGFAAVIEEKTPNTTGGQYPLAIKHSLSSGTAAAGMGTGLHFQLPDDLGNFKTTQLTVETTDASNATYTTRYRFMAQVNGTSTALAYLTSVGLGIGNVIPSYKLDVNGTVRAFGVGNTGNFLAVDTNPGGASVNLNPQYGTGLPILYTNGAFPLLLGTNNTENARFTSGGNFLIGTTTDNSRKLQVNGGATINGNSIVGGTSPIYTVFNVTSSTSNSTLQNLNRGVQSADPNLPTNFAFPYLQIGGQENLPNCIQTIGFGFTNGSTYIQPAEIGYQCTSTSGYTIGDLVFATRAATTNTAPLERMRITSAGLVGIGTSTPGSVLTVQQASTASTFGLRHTASGNGYGWQYATTGTTTNDLILNSEFNGSFTERVRITSGGTLLINSASVDSGYAVTPKLFVAGGSNNSIFAYANASGTYLQINTGAANGNVDLQIDARSGAYPPLTFTLSGSEKARFAANGNLLIGTTTDNGYKLQVNGAAYIGTSSTSNISTYIASNVAGVEINGGTGSATVGASAYMRIGDTISAKYWIQQINNNADLQFWFYDGGSWSTKQKLNNNGSIQTTAPSGGTAAAWKLGSRVAATVALDTTQYIELDVGGTLYKLAIVT